MIDQDNLTRLIEQQIATAVATEIQSVLESPEWVEKIGAEISAIINRRISSAMSSVNLNEIIEKGTIDSLRLNRELALDIFPGIQDRSDQKQLTLLPGVAVVENDLVAKNLEVVDNARLTNLAVHGDLTVTGSINTDNSSWNDLATSIADRALSEMRNNWKDQTEQSIIDHIQSQGIELASAKVNGEPLISNGQLNFSIRESRLETVGRLRSLSVTGQVEAAALYSNGHRVGINTQEPEMALSIWDEEINIGLGKSKQNQAFVGTSRSQELAIGVNGRGDITIDKDGTTTIKRLYVGKNQIGHATEVPNWSGTKGDVIFNSSYTHGSAFAWICLGAYKWQTIKSA